MNTLPIEKICLDTTTENCPCVAAFTKDCPVCKVLNHGEKCQCSDTWSGLCIYQKFLQGSIAGTKDMENQITVAQKIVLDQYVKIVCYVPNSKIANLQTFQAVKVTTAYKHPVQLIGFIKKVFPEKNLVTIAIKDTEYETPIKFGPLLQKGTTVELKPLGQVLPPLKSYSGNNILICVDNFWLCMADSLIDNLKSLQNQVSVIIPHPINSTTDFYVSHADNVISAANYSTITEEIKKPHYQTVLSLNTPYWQRKLVSLMSTKDMRKSLITVNNQWVY